MNAADEAAFPSGYGDRHEASSRHRSAVRGFQTEAAARFEATAEAIEVTAETIDVVAFRRELGRHQPLWVFGADFSQGTIGPFAVKCETMVLISIMKVSYGSGSASAETKRFATKK
jgi:hypothetical protein